MVFQHEVVVRKRLAGGGFVNELHMVRFDEVLHQQLPVGLHLAKLKARDRREIIQIEAFQLFPQRFSVGLEGRGIPADVDKQPIVQLSATHLVQPVILQLAAFRKCGFFAPEVRCRFESPL